MYIQNMWIKGKKYSIICVQVHTSNTGRIMQTYFGKLTDKSKEIKLATIEYHKPHFKQGRVRIES